MIFRRLTSPATQSSSTRATRTTSSSLCSPVRSSWVAPPLTAARTWSQSWVPVTSSARWLSSILHPVRPTLWLSLRLAWLPSSTSPSSVQQLDPTISDQVIKTLLAACATLTRHWLTWSSPTFPAASLRHYWTWLIASPATDGVLVAHELTQEELAQLVGASRETVNKALPSSFPRLIRLEARALSFSTCPACASVPAKAFLR